MPDSDDDDEDDVDGTEDEEGAAAVATSMSPPSSELMISPSLLNGTIWMSMPVLSFKSSIVRCKGLPTPDEP